MVSQTLEYGKPDQGRRHRHQTHPSRLQAKVGVGEDDEAADEQPDGQRARREALPRDLGWLCRWDHSMLAVKLIARILHLGTNSTVPASIARGHGLVSHPLGPEGSALRRDSSAISQRMPAEITTSTARTVIPHIYVLRLFVPRRL